MKYCSTYLAIWLGLWNLPLGALARECSIDYLNDIPCNKTRYELWQRAPQPSADNHCGEIEIRDEEPTDEGSDDTDNTTNEDTSTNEEEDDSGADSPSSDVLDTQSGDDESSEESVPGDGDGMVLPTGGVALIMAAIVSAWFSF
ncbi:hypothetical protein BJX63DRAFT_430876 [Aspergillus granulosus]|uniref:Uncharacterized protein n=1 Tax=Aspergillus granulosus TaxID=176169 RepID=A0ABR4HIQ0_9EURO